MKIATQSSNVIGLIGMFIAYGSLCIFTGDGLSAQEIKMYAVVDTGQLGCYDNYGELATCPSEGEPFYGQDNQNNANQPSYTDNGDSTVTDNVTGLMWQQSADTNGDGDIDADDKLTYDEAIARAEALNLGGHSDWRLPTIKELYSLIDFNGTDPSGYDGTDTSGLVPFIDTGYFDFAYGDTDAGERTIDAQYASSSLYVSNTANDGGRTLFGVNFADGGIKGYGLSLSGADKTFFVIYVRGNPGYGRNGYADNGDGTITDHTTDLMWSQEDSGEGLNWENALAWVAQKNAENYLGHSEWRLPNAKELQSIVDYTRSPDTTGTAAVNPLFSTTAITNEAGEADFPYYWSGTTHANWTDSPGTYGAYVAFGRAMGYMDGAWVDAHGAGAQRSDPKAGDPADYPTGNGPQGDAIRIYNYVRMVRDAHGWPPSDKAAGGDDAWLESILEERSGIGDSGTDWLSDDGNYPSNGLDVTQTVPDEVESASGVNIFTIDTRGNIGGLTGKILEVLP